MNRELRKLAAELIDAEVEYFCANGDSPDVKADFDRVTAEMSVAMMENHVAVVVVGETAIVLDELDEISRMIIGLIKSLKK